jgi:hypothetical protein
MSSRKRQARSVQDSDYAGAWKEFGREHFRFDDLQCITDFPAGTNA